MARFSFSHNPGFWQLPVNMRDLEAADKTFSPKKELMQSRFDNALLLFSIQIACKRGGVHIRTAMS